MIVNQNDAYIVSLNYIKYQSTNVSSCLKDLELFIVLFNIATLSLKRFLFVVQSIIIIVVVGDSKISEEHRYPDGDTKSMRARRFHFDYGHH